MTHPEIQFVVPESNLVNNPQARFSHGVCPDCMRKLYPEYTRKNPNNHEHHQ